MVLTSRTAAWQQAIQYATRRARLAYAVQGLCAGWLIGGLASALLLALAWALHWDVPYSYCVALTLVPSLGGIVAGISRRITEQQTALWLDRQAHIQERLTTAAWLSARGHLTGLEQLQIADTEEIARALDIRQLTHIPVPRMLWAALAATVLAVFFWFAPDIAWLQTPQIRQEKQAMRAAGERAERIAQEWRGKRSTQDREKMQRLSAKLAALAKQMKRARMDKREALVKLSRLQREAEEQQRRLAQANSGKPLQRAADEFLSARSVQEQLQQAKMEYELGSRFKTQSAARKIGNAQASTTPFANQVAAQMALALSQADAQKLAELLRQIAEQWNKLSPEEHKKLEELMRQLAEALRGTDLDAAAKELQEALKYLRVGDLQQVVKWIQKAGGSCRSAGACALDARQWAELAMLLAALKAEIGGLPVPVNLHEKWFGGGFGTPATGPRRDALEFRVQQNADTARLNVKGGKPTHVPGVATGQGEMPVFVTRGAPDAVSSGVLSYEMYIQYRRAAESALQRETIPPEYRQPVQKYFDSIKP